MAGEEDKEAKDEEGAAAPAASALPLLVPLLVPVVLVVSSSIASFCH